MINDEIERIRVMYEDCDVKLPEWATFDRDDYRDVPMGDDWDDWDWGFEEHEIEGESPESIAALLAAYRYYITDLERRLML